MAKEKICICANPLILKKPIEGYVGFMKCAECEGTFHYPRVKPTKKMSVEDYIENLESNYEYGMSFEVAVLKLLQSIEKNTRGKR